MAITVEDGSGVSSAEAWADLAAHDAWALKFHGAASDKADAVKEAAIRRAVAYLDTLPWKGSKSGGRAQALSWPRDGATDAAGSAIEDDEIPVELIRAQHMLTWAEIAKPGILNPSVNMAGGKALTKVDGIQWTLTGGEGDSIDAHRTLVMGALDTIVGLMVKDPRDVKDRDVLFLRSVG